MPALKGLTHTGNTRIDREEATESGKDRHLSFPPKSSLSVGMALAGLAQFREEEQQEEKAVGILRQSSRDWV